MNVDGFEYYNVGAIEEIPGHGSAGLMRLPKGLRNQINERGRFVGMDSVGCEIRFVTDAANIDVYVSCTALEFGPPRGELRVFKGNFQCGSFDVEAGRVLKIRLNPPPAFDNAMETTLNEEGFKSSVWRLALNRGSTFCIHGIDTHGHAVRPPTTAELPKINWLAYGSSITNSTLDGYPHVAARLLKAQVQNKGMSGSCHLEPVLIDWLVDECTWDVATVEMGINMRGCFTPEQFKERAEYAIRRFADTGKPVLVTNIYPNCFTPDKTKDRDVDNTRREEAFNCIVENVVAELNRNNLHFVHGYEILDDFTGLSGDLLHPCQYGHAIMGMNLAGLMRSKLLTT